MDVAAAESVMVVDAEEIQLPVASQVVQAALHVASEDEAGIVSLCTTESGCSVHFVSKRCRDKAILACEHMDSFPLLERQK